MRQQSSEPSGPSVPSVPYTIAFLIGASLLAIAAPPVFAPIFRVQEFPDMASYAEAATAVRHWHHARASRRASSGDTPMRAPCSRWSCRACRC